MVKNEQAESIEEEDSKVQPWNIKVEDSGEEQEMHQDIMVFKEKLDRVNKIIDKER